MGFHGGLDCVHGHACGVEGYPLGIFKEKCHQIRIQPQWPSFPGIPSKNTQIYFLVFYYIYFKFLGRLIQSSLRNKTCENNSETLQEFPSKIELVCIRALNLSLSFLEAKAK